jgi:hypothetical protein
VAKAKVKKKINCMKCEHYYVTWDKKFPNGCKAYGFKTKHTPSADVLSSSGMDCQLYEAKKKGSLS